MNMEVEGEGSEVDGAVGIDAMDAIAIRAVATDAIDAIAIGSMEVEGATDAMNGMEETLAMDSEDAIEVDQAISDRAAITDQSMVLFQLDRINREMQIGVSSTVRLRLRLGHHCVHVCMCMCMCAYVCKGDTNRGLLHGKATASFIILFIAIARVGICLHI
jgi:hypothetical protein